MRKRRGDRTETKEPTLHTVRFFVGLRDSHEGSKDKLIGQRLPSDPDTFLTVMARQFGNQVWWIVRHSQSEMVPGGERRRFDTVAGVEEWRVWLLNNSRPHGYRAEAEIPTFPPEWFRLGKSSDDELARLLGARAGLLRVYPLREEFVRRAA